MPIPRIGMHLIDSLYAGELVRYAYNRTKERREIWTRSNLAHVWVLFDALPARVITEDFMGAPQLVPALLGLLLERSWATNGDPAPVAANFVEANEIGGGLVLRCLGAGANDWVAMHTGGNYPLTVAYSPHLKITADIVDTTDVFILGGLVGASNLETGNNLAWTVPDDGIWVEYDTSVDGNMRFVTSIGGVQTSTSLGAPPVAHSSLVFVVNDAADEAKMILNGTVVATHTTNLPTAQLKPLAMCGCRAVAAKDLRLHDLRLIFDRGWS